MKKYLFSLIFIFSSFFAFGQSNAVIATGTGVLRADALQDALRNAVGQAAGVALVSNTTVENFMVISDAIASNTKGYIKSYSILEEKNNPNGFEIKVNALVTTSSMKADFSLLSKGIGGVRFMAIYDPRGLSATEKVLYDFALDRMNNYFASKRYRYIERTRFLELQKEAMRLMEDRDTSGVSYAQQIAMLADAQFIILIKNISQQTTSEQFDTKKSEQTVVHTIMYDNCTAEGLGAELLKSNLIDATNEPNSARAGVESAIKNEMDNVLETFSDYIGGWINNGIPYELRFYGVGGFRDLRQLRTKLKTNVLFGGEMEISSAQDFTKINCTFKKKPDELADKVLDYSDQIPALAAKKIDVKLIYGRQICFAPKGIDIKKKKIAEVLAPQNPKDQQSKPVAPPNTPTSPTINETINEGQPGFRIFAQNGEKFWLIISGQKINEKPAASVGKNMSNDGVAKIRVIFQDSKIPPIDKTLMLESINTDEKYFLTYTIRKNSKGRMIIRMVSAMQIKSSNEKLPNQQNLSNNPADKQTKPENVGANKCKTPVSSQNFEIINQQILATPFSDTKIIICNQIITVECFDINQIKTICNHFSLDQDKLAWVKMAYNACTEPNKYYLLNSVFTFIATKQAFNTFLLENK